MSGIVHKIAKTRSRTDQLRDSLTRYRELIEQIPAVTYISILDETRSRIYTSPQIKKLSGYTSDEWLTDPSLWIKQLHSEDKERVLAELQQCQTTGEPFCSEYRFLARDGYMLWVRDEAVVVHDRNGKPEFLQGLMREVTERKHAELALHESESKLRAIFAAMPDVILVLNAHGQYVEIAPTNLKLLYRPPQNLLGHTLDDVFPNELAEEFLEYIHRALETKQTVLADYGLQINNQNFWFTAAISPMNENKVIWVARDVTEQKRTEKALAASDERFRTLILNSTDIISIHDEQGFIKYVTPSIEAILGYAPEELIERNAFELVHPEDLDKLAKEFNILVQGGDPGTWTEYRVRHANGLWLYLETIGTDLSHGSGVEGIVLTSRDVTERKRIESEIHQRVSELDAVNRISTVLRTEPTLKEVLERFLEETLAVLNTDAGILWLYDASRQEMRESVTRGWCTRLVLKPEHSQVAMVEHILRTGEILTSPEIRNDERLDQATRALIPKGWGGTCVPIRTTQEIVGLLFVSTQLPRQLCDSEVHFLVTLAEIAGNAIHRMRLHEQTENQVAQLTVLRIIDDAISSNLDLRVAINILLNQITAQLRLDAAAVLLLNKSHLQLEFAAGRGFRSRAVARTRFKVGEGYAGNAALERRLIHVPDLGVSGSSFLCDHSLGNENFVSYYAAPLIAGGEVLGVLEIFHRTPLEVDPEWEYFLQGLSSQAALAIEKASLFEKLQRTNVELTLAYEATIEGWSMALDLRDKETEGHTQRVTQWTVQLAKAVGLKDEDLVHVRRGALLHDIGKMGVPDAILLKAGDLTSEETTLMQRHPQYAYDMLSRIIYLQPAIDIPYCHHEKWDGSGYPRGLKGEQIPMPARIFAVIDVYDALTSDRPYRKGWSEKDAIQYIREQSGRHFDPRIVEVFLNMFG